MSKRIIGIDFGTSTTVVHVKSYDDEGTPLGNEALSVKTVEVNGGYSKIPTLIRKVDNAMHPYYGFDAKGDNKRGSILYQNFKLDLESDDADKKQQARELTKEFLKYIHDRYSEQSNQNYLGESGETERTLVSYPVKWSEETRLFMLEAAKEAGFSNVEGVDEAQASIWSSLVQCENYLSEKEYIKEDEPANILLVDMGAGTTDIVICRYTYGENAENEIISTWPKTAEINFGGSEVDKILMDYIFSKMPDEIKGKIKRKIEHFKEWKEETVSPALAKGEMVQECSCVDGLLSIVDMELDEFTLDRDEFERVAADYLACFSKLVNEAIENSGLESEDIDLVIVTGGHSQWYFVNEMLCGNIGNINLPKIKADNGRIIPIARPQETVSLGLVYEPLTKKITLLSEAVEAIEKEKDELVFRDESLKRKFLTDIIVKDVVVIGGCLYKLDGSRLKWKNQFVFGNNIQKIYNDPEYSIYAINDNKKVIHFDDEIKGHGDFSNWEGVVSIANGRGFLAGLKEDGTVYYNAWEYGISDYNYETIYYRPDYEAMERVKHWKDIVSIVSDGGGELIGLKNDGTIVSNYSGTMNLTKDWKDIVSIEYCIHAGLIGIKNDGTVMVSFSDSCSSSYEITQWKDIVSVSASCSHILGLKKDGTVVAFTREAEGDRYGFSFVAGWRDVVEVIASFDRSFGVMSDGRVIYTDYEMVSHGFIFKEYEPRIVSQKISNFRVF